MKKTKILIASLLTLAMTTLAACGGQSGTAQSSAGNTSSGAAASSGATSSQGASSEVSSGTVTPAAFEGKLQAPFIVTSCGQSPGAVMVNMVATQAGLASSNDNNLSVDSFDAGDAKTLIITTGTSGKGMGAAGTDVDTEIARCTELIAEAKKAGLSVCCAHVEGMARRTDSSDQASIDAIIALADTVLIIEESDSDGMFTDYTTKNNLPLLKVKDALDIGTVME